MLSSFPALAGLGSLQVNSALGEPFSGTVFVTGDEAKAALSGKSSISGANLQVVKVTPQGQNAVIHLRSSSAIQDPMMSFSLISGNQGRQYTAMLDPRGYAKPSVATVHNKDNKTPKDNKTKSANNTSARRSEARATAALNNAHASDKAVVEYTVDGNETLTDVARKVRPQGLTLAQTMHALVVANPHAFRNGNPDFIYRNAKLKIPSTAELSRLAKQKINENDKRVDAAVERAAETPRSQQAAAGTHNSNHPVADRDNKVDSAHETPSVSPNPVVAPASAENAIVAEHLEPTPASQEIGTITSDASAASVEAAQPVEPKTEEEKPAQPVTNTEPEPVDEEGTWLPDWWPYAAGGGVGGLLIIAILLLMRRKKATRHDDEDFDDDDDSDDEDDFAADDDDFEDDDDIVFVETPEIQHKATSDSENEHPLASTSPTTAEADIAETSASSAEDDWSWLTQSEIPAQEISEPKSLTVTNTVEEVTPEPLPEQHHAEATEVESTPMMSEEDWLNLDINDDAPTVQDDQHDHDFTSASLDNVEMQTTESHDRDLSWLDQIDEPVPNEEMQPLEFEQPLEVEEPPSISAWQEETAQTFAITEEEPEKEMVSEPAVTETMEWRVTDDTQPISREEKAAQSISLSSGLKKSTDNIDSEKQSFITIVDPDDEEIEHIEQTEAKPSGQKSYAQSSRKWNIAYKFDEGRSESEHVAPESDQQTISQTLAPQEQSAFAAKDEVVTTDIDWNALNLEEDSPVLVTDEPSQSQANDDGVDLPADGFSLSDDLDGPSLSDEDIHQEEKPVVAETSVTPPSSFATGKGIQDWERDEPKTQIDQPLTPEQLAVPLQAKLELAKMYLEMDDAVTARLTLRELVEEANGTILAEAQNLLYKLGG